MVLIHVPAKAAYNTTALATLINEAINQKKPQASA